MVSCAVPAGAVAVVAGAGSTRCSHLLRMVEPLTWTSYIKASTPGCPGSPRRRGPEGDHVLEWRGHPISSACSAAQALGRARSPTSRAGPHRDRLGPGKSGSGDRRASVGYPARCSTSGRTFWSSCSRRPRLGAPLERGSGTLWLSHLPGRDSDQRALGEALALAAAERRMAHDDRRGRRSCSARAWTWTWSSTWWHTPAQALGDRCQLRLLD